MNEAMEAELTDMDSITDTFSVTEEANADESIPIDLKKEQITEAYKEKMSKYIENIDTYETRTKVNTTKWRPIYELIDKDYFIGSIFVLDYFIKECKDISNESRDIPRDVKNNIKRMAMEQGLYAHATLRGFNFFCNR